MDLGKSKELLGWKGVQGWTMDPPVDDEGITESPLKRTVFRFHYPQEVIGSLLGRSPQIL